MIFAFKYLDKFTIKKICYFLDDIIINYVIDSLLKDNLVTKKYGNSKILIKDNKISYYK